tara:strand:+ start:308 stop:760 length:453 start_codon:yes stop_codon:yes gene_type:complete
MSTRSNIAVLELDGTVEMIYVHWDGYIEHNGVILHTYYNCEVAARELVSKGNISTLKKHIAPLHYGQHSYNDPEPDVTVFYGRDRKDSEEEAVKYDTLDEATEDKEKYMYVYYVAQQVWMVKSEGRVLMLLEEAIAMKKTKKTMKKTTNS